MADKPRIVIVGAGPAGIRAAEVLARHRLRPILIDEGPKSGGQIYRQPPDAFHRSAKALYGFEAGKATALIGGLERLRNRLDYRPSTLAWNIWNREVLTLREGKVESIPFDVLLLATGAMDRVVPIPGWTLPGVFSLGGAQIALKYQGAAIGRRTVFLGTGPLLYLAAYQYAKAGAEVAAVLDTSPAWMKRDALGRLMAGGRTLAKGLYYYAWLRARRIPVREGIVPAAILGDRASGVTGFAYHGERAELTIDCDAVALGFGLKAETQLADLAGCRFYFDTLTRQWLPERDEEGESSVPGIFLAGDGAAIGGADVAELWGERVGLVIAERCGRRSSTSRRRAIDRALERQARFRLALEEAFPFPAELAQALPDDVLLCRCEAVTVGALRAAVETWGVREINRLKALTRIGMGRCQGRLCAAVAAEILAQRTGVVVEAVGRLRGQPPVKPIPIPWTEAT